MSSEAPHEPLDAVCRQCGGPLPDDAPATERRCTVCFDACLRAIDNDFLDGYGRLGARGRIVVAEACLRELVVADSADRPLLAVTIYEQFTAVAGDLIALYFALFNRHITPISRAMLQFELDAEQAREFFGKLARDGPAEMLCALGLPHPDQMALLYGALDARERRHVRAALAEAVCDFDRLAGYRDVGELALVSAARRLHGPRALVDGNGWLGGGSLEAGYVRALALGTAGRSLEVNDLRTDEETLGNVVDGIDIMTRLIRNVIFAYVSLQPLAP